MATNEPQNERESMSAREQYLQNLRELHPSENLERAIRATEQSMRSDRSTPPARHGRHAATSR